MVTCRHALPGRQPVQQAVLEGRGGGAGRSGGAGRAGGLGRGQAGSLPGLGGGPGFGERAGEGRGGGQGGLPRGGDGGVALGVAERVRGRGAGRGGRQADRGGLARRLVRHPPGLAVRSLGWGGGQFFVCWGGERDRTDMRVQTYSASL